MTWTQTPPVTTADPRTGTTTETGLRESTGPDVESALLAAEAAAAALADLGRSGRAELLESIADAVEADGEGLVRTADQETALGAPRLPTELRRAAVQFRMFAGALREGSYVEAQIDHAADTPLGPGPDLRRMLVPIGPVAIFGASNFPFAFSVLGGDTASALAVGCPVVLKAHDSHPLTSLRSWEAITAALRRVGAPEQVCSLVFGHQAAIGIVSAPEIRAVGFTGSLSTARILMQAINEREEPIPFYGELSSLNPLVITPEAARRRGSEIAAGLLASFTGSGGQFCTKPGLALIPSGQDGDRMVAQLSESTGSAGSHVVLNRRIAESFRSISEDLQNAGAQIEARADQDPDAVGFLTPTTLLTTSVAQLNSKLSEECFGPLLVVARYASRDELLSALAQMAPSLTGTIHAEPDELELTRNLAHALRQISGRLIFNGFPTGVRVSWAQHHGGPWPATNSLHTSVGVSALRRFLRPFAWQSCPPELLPAELDDNFTQIPRRIDGRLVPAKGTSVA